MKASLRGRYEYDTTKSYDKGSATSTLAFNFGDVKLRASMTEATFIDGPSFKGVGLGIEKPGSFSIDYDVPKKDFKFQYMNTIRVAEKPLNMTYIHNRNDNETKVKGTLVLNSANKVSVNHKLGTKNTEFTYTYVHRGLTTIEPCYDLAEDSWDFAVSQKVYGDDVLKASYKTSKQILGLEWSRKSKLTGNFKMSASVNLTEEPKKPKFFAETTWDFDHVSFAN